MSSIINGIILEDSNFNKMSIVSQEGNIEIKIGGQSFFIDSDQIDAFISTIKLISNPADDPDRYHANTKYGKVEKVMPQPWPGYDQLILGRMHDMTLPDCH